MVVVSDDKVHERTNDLAKRTADAHLQVNRLHRLLVPGEFLTVVRLQARRESSSG